MKFSERKGYKEVAKIIQIEGMNDALKNSLWNFLDEYIFTAESYVEAEASEVYESIYKGQD